MQMKNKIKAGVAVLISDKMDFKTKAIVRDKEEHYIMMKGTIQQVFMYLGVHNIGAPKYISKY